MFRVVVYTSDANHYVNRSDLMHGQEFTTPHIALLNLSQMLLDPSVYRDTFYFAECVMVDDAGDVTSCWRLSGGEVQVWNTK